MAGIDCDLLISEIQKREALWNKRSKLYKNRFLVESSWEEVANLLKLPKEDLKAKWKNLRDNFNKELKKIPVQRSGDGGEEAILEYRGRWQHFTQLLFLKDIQIPRVTEGNLTESLDLTSQPIEVIDSSEMPIRTEESIYEFIEAEDFELSPTTDVPRQDEDHVGNLHDPSTASARGPPAKKQKSKMTPFEEKLLQMEEEKLKLVGKTARVEDEDTSFFDSLLPYFKKLGDIQKLKVRNEYQTILIRELSLKENTNNE